MSSKGILAGLVSAILMVGVSAWAMDHDDDEHHGRGHEVHGNAHVEGAAHGKKVGWHGCDVPPGQAKKVGCVAPPPPAHVVVVTPPPPPAHVVVVAPPPPQAHIVVVAPPPPSVHIVVKTPKLPPPPSVGLHVDVHAAVQP